MDPSPPATLTPPAFAGLTQAIAGLRNRRALAAMLGCMSIGVLVAGVCSAMAAQIGLFPAFLGGLFLVLATATGVNAAGALLMDQARGIAPRPLGDAVVYALLCLPKLLALLCAALLAALALCALLALAYLVCRLPALGPVLFVAVFPLSVLAAGLVLSALALGLAMALPAVWQGATLARALAQSLEIARTRLVEALLLLAIVALLAVAVGAVVFGVLFVGLVPVIALSAAVFGGDAVYAMFGFAHGAEPVLGALADAGAAYAAAVGIGAGLLWALAGSVVSLVGLLGLNLAYLRLTDGLDVDATESVLQAHLDEAARHAAGLGQKAREAAERAREQARHSAAAAAGRPLAPAPPPVLPGATPRALPPGATAPAVSPALTCPHCLAPVGPADTRCAACGHALG